MKKTYTLITFIFIFFSFAIKLNAITNITINNNKLIPDFDINTKVYNVFVSSKTEIITINVESLEDEIVTGDGSKSLKQGLNVIEIIIYKNEKLTDKYTLNIVRGELKQDKKVSTLKSLSIENHVIDFKSDTYEYVVNAKDDEEILNVSYIATNPSSIVKLTGDVNLTKEKNIIKLEVISEDKKNISTYTIKVYKNIKKQETVETKESVFDQREFDDFELKLIRIGLITLGIIILSILFYLIFIKKRTNKVPCISRNILRK